MIQVLTLKNLVRNCDIRPTLLQVNDDTLILPEEMPVLAGALNVQLILCLCRLLVVERTKVSHFIVVVISSLSLPFPASPSSDLYDVKDPLNNKVPTSRAICLKVKCYTVKVLSIQGAEVVLMPPNT